MSDQDRQFANEDNFKKYISGLDWIVDLDDESNEYPKLEKIADYYIKGLAVIELKTLKADIEQNFTSHIQAEVNEHNGQDGYPVLYGEKHLSIEETSKMMPDGSKFQNKAEQWYFRKIEGVLRNANKQIESTLKNINANKEVNGVVIIIFEADRFYNPFILADLIYKMMNSQSQKGGVKLPCINKVVLLQESFKIGDSGLEETIIPKITIKNDSLETSSIELRVDNELNKLFEGYAEYIGIKPRPSSKMEAVDISNIIPTRK